MRDKMYKPKESGEWCRFPNYKQELVICETSEQAEKALEKSHKEEQAQLSADQQQG